MINPCVLDTSIASFLLNRNSLIQLYRPHIEGATLVISFQTAAEMRQGAIKANWGERKVAQLEQFLQDTETIHSSDALTQIWAEMMQQSQRVGRRVGSGRLLDCGNGGNF